MQLTIHPFRLPLASPFRISHESRTEQPTIIVRLTDDQGVTGLGEAPMTRYYGLDTDSSIAYLQRVQAALQDFSFPEEDTSAAYPPEGVLALHRLLDKHFADISPFLRCALDVAAHDIWAKKRQQPLYACWGSAQPDRRIPTCYTIGFGPVEEMVEKVKAFPWPIYKIKLGTPNDLDIIRALRAVTRSPFRVDANTGWTQEQVLLIAQDLQKLGVEFIEQPLPVTEWEAQKELYHKCPLPILADESCQTFEDVARCQGHFHGINIKVVKCGGLLPARRMIQAARAAGLQLMAGCMTESSVGISAIAHLVPDLDYIDIDGALLLADDPAKGVYFDAAGIVQFPEGCQGTGARLKDGFSR